jgi:two-component system, cell cycle response regulator DivK
MRAKKVEDGQMSRRLAYGSAQAVGIEPCHGEKPLGARRVCEDPGESAKGNPRRVVNGIFSSVNNCQVPVKQLWSQQIFRGDGRVGGSMTKRILVVEDNDLNRKLFCDVLQASGFAVEPVADGNVAIERARSFFPNLVVMDIQLQDVSGLDLIADLKKDAQLADVPVLAVTAYAGKGDEQRIRDVGAEGYLAKPVSIGPFMAAVKGLVGQ